MVILSLLRSDRAKEDLHLSMPLKVVIYAGIAGVILLGIWPQPFIEISVAVTSVFTGLAAR